MIDILGITQDQKQNKKENSNSYANLKKTCEQKIANYIYNSHGEFNLFTSFKFSAV